MRQLRQDLKDTGISITEAAKKTGLTYNYASQILSGRRPMTDSAAMKFIRAFPELTKSILAEQE